MLRPITAQARASPSRPIAGLREELALFVMDPTLSGATKRHFHATKRAPGVTSGGSRGTQPHFRVQSGHFRVMKPSSRVQMPRRPNWNWPVERRIHKDVRPQNADKVH